MSEVMYSPDILQTSQPRETRNAIWQYISYLQTFKKCDLFRRKILYNIFSELGTARYTRETSSAKENVVK